ncbi:protein SCO1 homolog 1, mitochondrial isoform X1 [Dendrobium catenatum]|uniref:Protein SCO1 like 1, mitochondrial n=2 Tax=Dendrobium catenatum TaxID=906689 RepID=A0A2I0W860_9ASPA|nr:protein SCO1 homolog 1, mitochondrial isoform X1 [Dendrobium catenatum]PKU71858.1 Protein SCO1 like 1, mitochondrial [Dendrobium catenatum]
MKPYSPNAKWRGSLLAGISDGTGGFWRRRGVRDWLVGRMSRMKGLIRTLRIISQPQVIPLSRGNKGSSYQCLASATTTSGHTNVEKPVENASSEGKQTGNSDQTNPPSRSIRGGPVSWLSLVLLIMTGGGLIFYYDREKKRHIEGLKAATSSVKQGPSVGTAAIGGPFKLVNHDGKSVTEKDFLGKWTLIYFGFTHCPDICPDELQKMATAIEKIKSTAGLEIVPVFISVDPERDSVEQIHDYVKEFHPDLIGLTGTPSEVRQAARAYRVYYMKTEEEGSDYLVDHSIVMYLMNPNMEFVKFYGKNYDVDSLADGIIKEIKQYKK